MENERRQRYLETFLQRRSDAPLRELVPVVSRWNELLASIPGLQKRHPGAHCRISNLVAGVLTVEADHPAWLQLLQWHQREVVEKLGGAFPSLKIQMVQFRLSRGGDQVERPTTVMPEPVKPELTEEEQEQLAVILADLQTLIQEKSAKPEKPG